MLVSSNPLCGHSLVIDLSCHLGPIVYDMSKQPINEINGFLLAIVLPNFDLKDMFLICVMDFSWRTLAQIC